jgi:hypothetical protein
MEITEIILANVSRDFVSCISSHSRGILSRLKVFKSIGPGLWISWGGGGGGGEGGRICLPFSLSSLFYLWLFSLLDFSYILIKQIQNNQKTNRTIYTIMWN